MKSLNKCAVIIMLVITSIYAYAQNSDIEETFRVLKSTKNDSTKAYLNLKLCSYYQQKEPQKAFGYGRTGLSISKKIKNDDLIANSYAEIGLCYSFTFVNDSAKIYLDSSLSLYTKIKSFGGIAASHLYLGENYVNNASWENALSEYLLSIENFQLQKDNKGLSKAYSAYAHVLINMNRLDEALPYAKKSVEFAEVAKNDRQGAKAYNTLGIIYDYKGELDSALYCYNTAIELNTKIDSRYDAAITLMNIGVIYLSQGKVKLAEESTLKALDFMLAMNERSSVAACYANLGEIYLNLGQYAKSLQYLDKGIVMLKELKRNDFLLEALRIKAVVLKQSKDFEKALLAYEEYTQLKDSIFSEESNKNINEMQTKFKTKEQEVEIKLHQTETAKQKSINNFIIGIVVLMLGIAVFLVFVIRDKKKANALLHAQKLEIEKQKELVDEAYSELHEKNKEVLDSIYYARRIQRALLTSERYITKHLNRMMKKDN